MALTAKAAAQIGKLLDLHYCPGDDLEETARLQGKAENARALIDYLKATGMSNFNKLFFRTQASVMFWVEFQDSYRAIDLNVVAQHKNIILKEILRPKPQRPKKRLTTQNATGRRCPEQCPWRRRQRAYP